MTLYHNPSDLAQVAAISDFERLRDEFQDSVSFSQPSPEKAPWHWQVKLENDEGAPIFIDFWPHKAKAHCAGQPIARGYDAMRNLLGWAILENDKRSRD